MIQPPPRRTRPRLGPFAGLVAAATAAVLLGTQVTAGAQSGDPTTSVPPVTLPAENPGSGAASAVFFLVSGAIVVGALVLYLRHRGASRH